MDNSTLIGAGMTAEVFSWGNNRILKLFLPEYPETAIRQEYENARIIADLDFPKPAVYGMVEKDDRCGIVYSRVRGENLLDMLVNTGSLSVIRRMAELHRKVLSCRCDALTDYRDRLSRTIQQASWLDETERRDALETCRILPEAHTLCHGDFHPGNILLEDGRTVLIDFQDLCRGPALYDIARSYFLLRDAAPPASLPLPDSASFAQTRCMWAEEYLACMGTERDALSPYLKVVAASRSDAPR